MKRLTIVVLVLVVMMMSMSASAQVDCPPGIEGDDCALYTEAMNNMLALESASFTFVQSTSFDMGFMAIDQSAYGTGQLVLDGAGNIVAASMELPEITNGMGGMFGGDPTTQAGAFVFVDGVMYFGSGDSLDTLEWESFTPEATDLQYMDLTLSGFIGLASESTLGIDPMDFGVTYSRVGDITLDDGRPVTAFSYDIPEISISELMEQAMDSGMDAGDLSALGLMGMDGTISGTSSLYIDPSVPVMFIGMDTNITITLDMSGMLGDATEGTEGLEGLGDLFGGDMGGGVVMEILFNEFNATFDITAPADATPMDSMRADGIRYTSGLTNIITTYFTNLATEESMGDFGNFGGDFGMGDAFYSGNCTPDSRTIISGGSISYGETVEGNLNLGEAAEWTFQGSTGDVVTIAMNSEDLDSYLELLGPDGSGLASDDDGQGYPNPRIDSFELPADGTYVIVACTYWTDEAGSYTLSLGN
ncbi:MAG: hypothetical protein CUN56_02800 [Phototrophicales bacterium]|nr:MAG: hypothetical protein CUN56_02800 [Phototrophicales bacterium]